MGVLLKRVQLPVCNLTVVWGCTAVLLHVCLEARWRPVRSQGWGRAAGGHSQGSSSSPASSGTCWCEAYAALCSRMRCRNSKGCTVYGSKIPAK